MASLVFMVKPEILTKSAILVDTIISFGGSIIAFFIISTICFFEKKRQFSSDISFSYTCLLFITPFLTVYILIFFPVENLYDQGKTISLIIILTFLLLLNVLNYYFLGNILDYYKEKSTTELMKKQAEERNSNYIRLSHAYKDTRRIVHDIRKHDKYLLGCLHDHNYKEIEETLKRNLSELDKKYIKVNSGNLSIDTYIGNFLGITKYRGYQTECNITVDNQSIPIPEYELNIILDNLIDNCLKACNDMNPDTCIIKLDIVTNDKFFIIQLINPLPDKKPIKDTLYHGYGIMNIKQIVDKFNGVYYDNSEEVFKTTITIPIYRDSNGNMISNPSQKTIL